MFIKIQDAEKIDSRVWKKTGSGTKSFFVEHFRGNPLAKNPELPDNDFQDFDGRPYSKTEYDSRYSVVPTEKILTPKPCWDWFLAELLPKDLEVKYYFRDPISRKLVSDKSQKELYELTVQTYDGQVEYWVFQSGVPEFDYTRKLLMERDHGFYKNPESPEEDPDFGTDPVSVIIDPEESETSMFVFVQHKFPAVLDRVLAVIQKSLRDDDKVRTVMTLDSFRILSERCLDFNNLFILPQEFEVWAWSENHAAVPAYRARSIFEEKQDHFGPRLTRTLSEYNKQWRSRFLNRIDNFSKYVGQ